MAIKIFIYTLAIVSLLFVCTSVNQTNTKNIKKNIAIITFENSIMYTLNNKQVTRILQSSKLIRYKNEDEIHKATFISRAQSKNQEELTDIISADFIEKEGENLTFFNNVKYFRDDFLSFKTSILHYNLNTKIAKNSKKFTGRYYNSTITGKNIYLNTNKQYIRTEKIHFDIEL